MTKIYFILPFIVLLNSNLLAQIEWEKNYGSKAGDILYSIIETNDGYILSGSINSDLGIIKTDKKGNIEWQKNYGVEPYQSFYSSIQTEDGGFLFGGVNNTIEKISDNNRGTDFWIVKTDHTGDLTWEKNYGGEKTDSLSAILQTADGGFLLGGSTKSSKGDVSVYHGNGLTFDSWVVKINKDGDIVWEKNYGSSSQDQLRTIDKTTDNKFLIGIFFLDESISSGSTKLIKIDTDGSIEWEKNYSRNLLYDIEPIANGFMLGGYSCISTCNEKIKKMNFDYWLAEIDENGSLVWEKYYGGSKWDHLLALKQTKDNGFILGGQSESNDGDVGDNNGKRDFWVVKTNRNGDLEWENNFGGSKADALYALQQTQDGGFILGGKSFSNNGDVSDNNGGYDYWVVKISDKFTGTYERFSSKVYPNPTSGFFNIEFNHLEQQLQKIEIYDLSGRLVLQELLTQTKQNINFENKQRGIYFIKIFTLSGISFEKIIIQ